MDATMTETLTMPRQQKNSVKLDDDVMKSARIVSTYKDVHMSTLLSQILRPILRKMEVEEVEKRRKFERPDARIRKPKAGD